MLVEVRGASKAFHRTQVLKDIDLSIERGEVFGLIGPSGAGKTTLIRLMIGALPADAGEITIAGRRIPNLAALEGIGYMPQTDALYLDLSGRENLLFFGGMYQMTAKALRARAEEMLRLVELDGEGNKRVGQYSAGMRKRLSLAIALIRDPELLVLDEPTVGIDPVLRKKIWDRLFALRDAGRTVIVTTHVMDEAARCDRLALIYEGGVLACGETGALIERAGGAIESLFLKKEAAR